MMADYAPIPANTLSARSGRTGTHTHIPREICAQCGRSFPHLAALIEHAEAEHAAPRAPISSRDGGGREACPRCGARFSDVAALVEHVERAHERKRDSRQCRVS
jgi:uncharacterized C2H2 Zn-finger protein